MWQRKIGFLELERHMKMISATVHVQRDVLTGLIEHKYRGA